MKDASYMAAQCGEAEGRRMKTCEYMKAPWFADLARAIEATNKTVVAAKMGVNRSTLSAVVNGIGEYGKGTASTAKFQRQFQWAFGQMPCTYTGKNIDISYCRQHALVPAPMHNPMALRHWQGCQKCENKDRLAVIDAKALPKPGVVPGKKQRERKTTDADVLTKGEKPQQAGLIDKVTLPLPEVGGPQVKEAIQQYHDVNV